MFTLLKRVKSTTIIFIFICLTSVVTAQTTCNNGLGRVLYERLPNQQLQGFDDDVVRDTAPPFRVLEKCQDLCLRDRTATNNLVRACTSFDFQPGSRIAAFSGNTEYEETICYLTREQAAPEGIGNLMLVPNSVHFTEVCLTSSRPERECPSRRYVFERHPRKKLKLPISDVKEITAANRTDCEDKCLNEFSFVCRSANFDSNMRSCILSRFTRRTHPELLEDDPNSDYLENTCLNAERRCDGLAVFVKEENKRLGGPFEVDIFNNMTLEECQTMCLRAEKYFCRSVEYDDQTKQCILSEEDSISQKDDISISSSPTHHFYDLVCLDNQRGTDYPDNSVTSHLFSNGRRPDTAFQRYRNSRLGGEFHSEITGRSLSECLDECLRQTSFQCRSAVYSDRFRTCRLSRYNQRDGMRIIYDADYDYYENLMLNVVGSENDDRPNTRPDTGGGPDWRPPPSSSQYPGDRDRYPDDRYPGRYPPTDGKYPSDRYPLPPDYDRYPADRYPGEKYPSDRYPPERYPPERYPPERYPPERYPPERYPPEKYPPERYPPERYPPERYPPEGYPPERYPPGERYPGDRDRYPGIGDDFDKDRYPIDKYPSDGRDRYPIGGGRYPLDDRDRYPGYPDGGGRYPPYDGKYPPPERYPPVTDNRFPQSGYPRPYPIPDRGKYPAYDYSPERYPPGSKFPDELYPGTNRYPSRYPPPPPPPSYPAREGPYDSRFPDRRFRPSSLPPRYPPDGNVLTPESPRYPPDRPRYPPPAKYPSANDIPGPRRPPIEPDRRFPLPPGPPVGSKYPTTPNKFPVGSNRYPIDIYKYGNQDRPPLGLTYGRIPPTYYDFEYEDRYGDPTLLRPLYPSGYGSPYDREYDSGYGRRPPVGGYPTYDFPHRPPSGYDNSINPISGDGFGGYGPVRPPHIPRCEEVDNFKQVASRHKMRRQFIRRTLTVPTLLQCQRECSEARDFVCRSFNYRDTAFSYDDRDVPNCELSDRDSRELDVHNPSMFDTANYDYYERGFGRSASEECLDVSQVCNEEGMEFTLRTPEGFNGRIYTYGFYDRCFFRGNGGTVNVLRISGPQGYPECGTQRYGDTLTNIVVVQFSDNVQTSRDKRYNLTCVFRGPGEAVVTSGYIGAGLYRKARKRFSLNTDQGDTISDDISSGSPIPIEYLPAENSLSSKVRLMILYQGRPTTTIAVGDPLTFRLEAQDGYTHPDIFATNVVARDPYSGRSIQLIDRFGCPVDPYVFPELDKLRDGDTLEARFNAFKIPESNFLVFEATVRTCRDGCQPAYCPGPSGRSEPSFGRRKRSINETEINAENDLSSMGMKNSTIEDNSSFNKTSTETDDELSLDLEEPEQVREMIEVFETREEIENDSYARKLVAPIETVCLTPSEYHGLISAIILLMILLFSITLVSGIAYRRYWRIMSKSHSFDRTSPINSFIPSSIRTHERFSEIGTPTATTATTTGCNNFINGQSRSSTAFKGNGISLFGGSLQRTFATGNLARMCQIPVINPIRNNSNNQNSQFDDPSEPIYTDPSLFERSRSLRSLSVDDKNEV